MVFLEKRRARALAVALIVVLLVPIAVASADYWTGRRYNNKALNGFTLTQSVYSYGYGQSFRDAVGNWLGRSPAIDEGFVEYSSYVDGVDKYYVGNSPNLIDGGLTRYYGRRPGNAVYELITELPEDYHEQDWFLCTVALYQNVIDNNVCNGDDNFDLIEDTAAHEIGHTLKFAHAASGKGTSEEPRSLNGRRSLMEEKGTPCNLVVTPTSYDDEEIADVWGAYTP